MLTVLFLWGLRHSGWPCPISYTGPQKDTHTGFHFSSRRFDWYISKIWRSICPVPFFGIFEWCVINSNPRFSLGTDFPNQIVIASTAPETIWGYCTQLGATLGEINVIVSNCLPDRGSTGWGHFPTYHTPLIRRHVDISVTSVVEFEGAHVICCTKKVIQAVLCLHGLGWFKNPDSCQTDILMADIF